MTLVYIVVAGFGVGLVLGQGIRIWFKARVKEWNALLHGRSYSAGPWA